MVVSRFLLGALPLVVAHRKRSHVQDVPCDQCAQTFADAGGCELLQRDGDVEDSAIPDGCGECGDSAWELCIGDQGEPDPEVCDKCAEDVNAAGGCNALIHAGDLSDDQIPEGCAGCGDDVYDICCDDCVERFEEAGGCEFIMTAESSADIPSDAIPSGCEFCGDAAYDSCTLDAPSLIQTAETWPNPARANRRGRQWRNRRNRPRHHGWHGQPRSGWHHQPGWHGRHRGGSSITFDRRVWR